MLNWEARPDVYYFVEGSPDLGPDSWVTSKLIKDNVPAGSLTLGTEIINPKAFYRLILEGDPDSARLRADDDGDGIINLLEADADWDAFETATSVDSDLDGIPDYWELFHFGTLDHDGSYVAVVGGLTLFQAYTNGANPKSIDSDGDGWTDLQELAWGWDVNYDQSRDDGKYSLNGDFDGDNISNASEVNNNTNPSDNTDTPSGASPLSFVLVDLGENYYPISIASKGYVLMDSEGGSSSHYRRWYWGSNSDFDNEDTEDKGLPFQPRYELGSMNNEGQIGGSYMSQGSVRLYIEAGVCGTPPHERPNYAKIHKLFVEPIIIESDGTVSTKTRPSLDVSYSDDTEYHRILSVNDHGDYVVFSYGIEPEAGSARVQEVNVFSNDSYNTISSTSAQGIIVLAGSCDRMAQYTGTAPLLRFFNNENKIAGVAYEASIWDNHHDLRSGTKFQFVGSLSNTVNYSPIDMNQNSLVVGSLSGTYALHENSAEYALPTQLSFPKISSPESGEPLLVVSANNIGVQKKATDGTLVSLSEGSIAYYIQTTNELLHQPDAEGVPTKNAEWGDLSLSNVSDNGSLLLGMATKGGVSHAVLLLEMDAAAHSPAPVTDTFGNLQTGSQIPAADEDDPENLQFVVNDDNDDQRPYNSTYPKDSQLSGYFSKNEDDLVAVTFTFPKDIETGTLEISANVGSSNPEAKAYIITESMLKPTKELVSLNPATSVDLSSASSTDLLWELANEGEQTLYIEGLEAMDDLEIKLSFKANGSELASDSVHMEILPSTERKLKVLAWSGMGGRAMVHMNYSDNVLRDDRDGYKGEKDRVTPIAFRQDGAASSQGVLNSWRTVDLDNDSANSAIYDELQQQGANVYICEFIENGVGEAILGSGRMILGEPWRASQLSGGASKGTLAHEWLHAFPGHEHVNITDDLMWGKGPPPPEVDANGNGKLDNGETMVDRGQSENVSEAQYHLFID